MKLDLMLSLHLAVLAIVAASLVGLAISGNLVGVVILLAAGIFYYKVVTAPFLKKRGEESNALP